MRVVKSPANQEKIRLSLYKEKPPTCIDNDYLFADDIERPAKRQQAIIEPMRIGT